MDLWWCGSSFSGISSSNSNYSDFFASNSTLSLLPDQIVKNGGPQALYAGFIPIWARFAPTTCLQLVIFEQIKPIFGVEGSGE